MRDLPRSERSGRLLAYTFAAWGTMVAMLVVWWAREFYAGRIGDPEIRTVYEAISLPIFLMSIPYGVAAFGILLPVVAGLQAVTRGRLPRWGNMVFALVVALPTAELCWIIASMIFGRDRSFAQIGRIVMRTFHTFLALDFNPRGWIYPVALIAGLLMISAGAQRKGERRSPTRPARLEPR